MTFWLLDWIFPPKSMEENQWRLYPSASLCIPLPPENPCASLNYLEMRTEANSWIHLRSSLFISTWNKLFSRLPLWQLKANINLSSGSLALKRPRLPGILASKALAGSWQAASRHRLSVSYTEGGTCSRGRCDRFKYDLARGPWG